MNGNRKRKIGPFMLALYRLADRLDAMPAVTYANWVTPGAAVFVLIIWAFIPVIPLIPTMMIVVPVAWITAYLNRRGQE